MGLFDGTPLENLVQCTTCGAPAKECRCPPPQMGDADDNQSLDPSGQRISLMTERRARGKLVTVIKGVKATPRQLQTLLKSLKDQCGTGGTVSGGALELQGDQVERLRKWMGGQGYRIANK